VKIQFISLIVCFLLGCTSQPGIKVCNLKNNKSFVFSGKSGFYDEIVPMSMDSNFVYSIYKQDKHLQLVKRDLKGAILKQHSIPLFSEWYGATPYALCPDENKFVYYKDNTRDIYLYNLSTKSESVLLKEIASSQFAIKGIFWMDSDILIVVLDDDEAIGRTSGGILKFKISTNAALGMLRIEDPLDYSFSPASMLLAVTQMARGSGLTIIDLHHLSIVSEIQNSDKITWMNKPAWDRSGMKLIYADGFGVLRLYNTKDKSVVDLLTLPKGAVAYFTGLPGDNVFAVKYGQPGGKSALYLMDMNTQKVTTTFSDVWGNIVFVDNGNAIAYVKH
jgi:hypothetical protein